MEIEERESDRGGMIIDATKKFGDRGVQEL
jgi:hypothetical protein